MPDKYVAKGAVIVVRKITDQIITAIEGGTGYWLSAFQPGPGHAYFGDPWYANQTIWARPDFHVTATTHEDGSFEFTPKELQRGLDVVAEKYPNRLFEILDENGDAETADVFLQCCLFGEVVYG